MIYADDTRVYVMHTEHATCTPRLEQCIVDIMAWSMANGLKLNENKTEVYHISSKLKKKKTSALSSANMVNVPIQLRP